MSTPQAHCYGSQGKPVVLLHGIGGNGSIWAPQFEALAEEFRVFAWDMPGYGASEPLAEMTFPALAEALVRFLDAHAIDRAHLVGHSMGGMVAQTMVRLHPERVASLALCATSASFGPPGGDFQRQWVADRIAPLDAGRGMSAVAAESIPNMIADDPDPEGVALATRSMAGVSEAAYRAAVACIAGFDERESQAKISVPTLLIAGEKDPSAPLKAMKRMEAAISGAELVVVPGAGHLLPLERPDAFNRALADFLGRID